MPRQWSLARWNALALLLCATVVVGAPACSRKPEGPRHRERDPSRDRECKTPARPRAFFYPAENRTDYKPDDPSKDGCELLVADHLFCCPDAPRPTDR
jgi:hypothetical protein